MARIFSSVLVIVIIVSIVVAINAKKQSELQEAAQEAKSVALALEAQKIQEAANALAIKTAYEAELAKKTAILKAAEAKAAADTAAAKAAADASAAAAALALKMAQDAEAAKLSQQAADALKAETAAAALAAIEASKLALEANPPKDAVFSTLIGSSPGNIEFSYVGDVEEKRMITNIPVLKDIPFVVNQKIPEGVRTVQIIPDGTANVMIKGGRVSLYGINIIPASLYGSVTATVNADIRIRVIFKDGIVSAFSPIRVLTNKQTIFFIDTNGKQVDRVNIATGSVGVTFTKLAIGSRNLLPSTLENTTATIGGKLAAFASALTEDKRGMIPILPGDDGGNQARIDNLLAGRYIWGGASYYVNL
jgi:hypothetical protein